MVIFGSLDEVNGMIKKIRDFKLKNNIPQDFEFHYSRNAKTKKDKFARFVKREVKEVWIVKADKSGDDIYLGVARSIVDKFKKDEKYAMRLDSNPQLFRALKVAVKERKLKAKISEEESSKNSLIQVADYLAGMASEN
jgi:hypothetical protein